MKLLHYGEKTPLDTYLVQVRVAAQHKGWIKEEMAVHLALVLQGDALQALLGTTMGGNCSLQSENKGLPLLAMDYFAKCPQSYVVLDQNATTTILLNC